MAPAIGLTSGGQATPGFSYTFGKAGTYFIVCPIGGGYHCNAGMKFQVTVNPGNQPLIPVPVSSSSAPNVPLTSQPAPTSVPLTSQPAPISSQTLPLTSQPAPASIQTTQGAPASTGMPPAASTSQASGAATTSAPASAVTTSSKAAASNVITSDAVSFSVSLVSSVLLISLFV
ncbi:hypothetical protein HDU98_009451 [Podochytrium sp. JEL0797]|nr:hypothetical protein HDU98_009451 [Podochytrium sp. JEL0797]